MKRIFISLLTASALSSAMLSPAFAQTDLEQAQEGLTQTVQPQTIQPQTIEAQDTSFEQGPTQQELYEIYLQEKAANAQTATSAAPGQERCITIMSGFPNSGPLPRYQFFKLSEDLAADVTPEFRSALSQFGDGEVADTTPVLDVVEIIANPVLRQAAPEIVVANMAHLIGFAQDCETYLTGQIDSLRAVNNSLSQDDIIIAEDALYLRQVLTDSLSRLGGEQDGIHGPAVNAYTASLVASRDRIEFAGFDNDIEDLESLYMIDLDGRLARSNNVINEEINRETLGDAVVLSRDLSNATIEQEKTRSLRTLLQILGGGR